MRNPSWTRPILIVANLAMLALPTYAAADDGGGVAAGLALGCCAGMAGAALMAAADADAEARQHAEDNPPPPTTVTNVYHVVDEPSAKLLDKTEARAELAEAELWSQRHCVAEEAQADAVRAFVTFRGADGRAARVWFEPTLRGADFEACMHRAFGTARVAPFDRSKTTVSKSLGEAAPAASP
ncbi:MAG: hypothetical protein AAF928_22245 [Myxococcota bacterium]